MSSALGKEEDMRSVESHYLRDESHPYRFFYAGGVGFKGHTSRLTVVKDTGSRDTVSPILDTFTPVLQLRVEKVYQGWVRGLMTPGLVRKRSSVYAVKSMVPFIFWSQKMTGVHLVSHPSNEVFFIT